MTGHQEEQAALHALHLLTAEEARILESEMRTDAKLRQTFDDHVATLAEFGSLLPMDETAPTECRALVLSAVRRKKKENSNAIPIFAPFRLLASPWVAWAAAAALAFAAFSLWDAKKHLADQVAALTTDEAKTQTQASTALAVQEDLKKQLAAEESKEAEVAAELEKLKQVNALARMEVAELRTQNKRYEDGVAVVVWDNEKQEGKIRLDKMPPVQPNKDYQLWVLDKTKTAPVNAGVIRLDEKGDATLTFKPVETVTASKFAISVETRGGVPEKSADGPIIFAGP